MFRTMLIGMLMITCASIAAAQSADYKKFEVFAGYSHNRVTPALVPTMTI
jgi:hypothetical protein